MNTQSLEGSPHSRLRVAGLVLAAGTLPAFLSVSVADADTSVRAVAGSRAVALAAAPGDLGFSSYLGGEEWDEATNVVTDTRGNTYVTGFTLSEDFPVRGAAARDHDAIVDAFVTKIDTDSSRILWSTQLGGVDMDTANAITVDGDGNVYVAGRTGSPDFPVVNAIQSKLKGRSCTGEPCHDAFVAKLGPRGRLVWSTYFGGTENEEPFGIEVGSDGSIYIAGLTDSDDLPVRRPFQRTFQSDCPQELPCWYDAFVTKFAPNGNRLVYSTYLGGSGTDLARDLALDAAGNVYVVGSTGSPDFPTVRAFQTTTRGEHCGPPPGEPCRQAFVTKLSASGSSAVYSTYLGGKDHDDGFGVALDGRRRAHITGSTASTDFPTRNPLQSRLDNAACTSVQPEELCDDGFVTKLSRSGQELLYSTYLGGRAEDQGLTIDVTNKGLAVVGGRTDSTDFPTTANAAQPTLGGYIDGFAAKLRRGGTAMWSTFIGGEDADRTTGITADATGAAHLVGRTLSKDFPTARPFQSSLIDDDYDAFVSVIE
jgi:hypothetical protein